MTLLQGTLSLICPPEKWKKCLEWLCPLWSCHSMGRTRAAPVSRLLFLCLDWQHRSSPQQQPFLLQAASSCILPVPALLLLSWRGGRSHSPLTHPGTFEFLSRLSPKLAARWAHEVGKETSALSLAEWPRADLFTLPLSLSLSEGLRWSLTSGLMSHELRALWCSPYSSFVTSALTLTKKDAP